MKSNVGSADKRHLDPDWKKWSIAEAQAIFSHLGLTGEFWQLPRTDEARF